MIKRSLLITIASIVCRLHALGYFPAADEGGDIRDTEGREVMDGYGGPALFEIDLNGDAQNEMILVTPEWGTAGPYWWLYKRYPDGDWEHLAEFSSRHSITLGARDGSGFYQLHEFDGKVLTVHAFDGVRYEPIRAETMDRTRRFNTCNENDGYPRNSPIAVAIRLQRALLFFAAIPMVTCSCIKEFPSRFVLAGDVSVSAETGQCELLTYPFKAVLWTDEKPQGECWNVQGTSYHITTAYTNTMPPTLRARLNETIRNNVYAMQDDPEHYAISRFVDSLHYGLKSQRTRTNLRMNGPQTVDYVTTNALIRLTFAHTNLSSASTYATTVQLTNTSLFAMIEIKGNVKNSQFEKQVINYLLQQDFSEKAIPRTEFSLSQIRENICSELNLPLYGNDYEK